MSFQQLHNLELRQVLYFMEVVQSGNNISEAARRLNLTQPPLTQRIQALEKFLGTSSKDEVKLFDRRKKPMELTEAGKAFAEEVEQALFHLDQAIMLARQAKQGLFGQVTIGLNNAIMNSGLSDVIKTFQQKFPNVKLILREVPPEDEVPMLKKHQLDLIFLRSPSFEQLELTLLDSALCCKKVLQEYFVAALPTEHPLAAQSKISLHALQDEAFILPPVEILPFYERVIRRCREVGFEPRIVQSITVTGAITLLNLVAAGMGISILPNHIQTLKRDGVIYRPIEDPTGLERQIAAVWRQDDDSIVLQHFLQVLRESPLGDGW